jgi:hypothetical protein
MKVKNKNFVGIMMLALMLIFGLSLNAEALITAYTGTITIANNATTSQTLGGDITITGTASDMASGSDIWLTCPSGLKFDTTTTLEKGTNITVSNFDLSAAYYSTDGTRIILTVSTVPAGNGTVAFKSTLSVKPTPTAGATNQNVIGQQFTLTTNVGTIVPGPLDTLLGSIKILEPPEIVSATLVSGTAVDVLFSTNISGTSTALGSLVVDDTTDTNPIFLITKGNGSTTSITSAGSVATRDATNNALVHITGITGTIYAGNEIAYRTASGKNITNALGAINGPDTSPAVPINPVDSSIGSVVISNAPKYTGDAADAFNTVNTFTATVTATASSVVKVRVPNGTVATTGITWTGTTDSSYRDSTSGVGTFLMPTGGSTVVSATLSGNSLCATGNTVITGTVQASLDNFLSSTSSTSGDLIINRKQPVITGTPTSPNRYTMVGLFSEDVDSTTVVPTGFTIGGGNSGATISSAALGADKKSFTLTTSLLSYATNNTIAATTTIKDLAGNIALTTASPVFDTQGTATTSTSITGLNPNSAQAGSLIVSNGDTISVTITGPTAASANARVVNSADNTITGITTGAVSLSETGVGVYTGTVIVTTIGTGISGVKVQGTMDGFAQVTTSSESLTVDNTAPTVTSAQGAGTTAMLVTFSEQMNTNVALTATASYSIIGSLSGTRAPSATGIFRSPNQVVLRTTTTPTIAGETVIVDVAATDVRDLTFNSVSFGSNTNLVDRAQYTGPAADTVAPTILGAPVVAIGDTKVTVYITDNSGSAAVDIGPIVGTSATKITSVTKGGNNVNGTPSNDTVNVACIFTPIAGTFPAGDYVVNLNAADLAGNPAVLSTGFTVSGDVSCSANPTTVTLIGGTSTITATGGLAPYTATIASDTTGGATLTTGSTPWTLTPGATAGSITVRISDSQSPARTCDATVAYAPCILTVAATKSAVNGEKISVSATGGVLPYVYELTTATATGAAIDPVSGDYLAPSASGSTVAVETETIKATDANGCSGTTTVKISTDAVAVTTTGSGTNSVTISGGTGATFAIKDGVGAVTAGGVYTSTEDGVGIVRVTATTGEWADVIIKVASGICTVESPVMVQDVNMDGAVGVSDLIPVIDAIP